MRNLFVADDLQELALKAVEKTLVSNNALKLYLNLIVCSAFDALALVDKVHFAL